ncbi:unnamed protein product [Diamesa serratosioi]
MTDSSSYFDFYDCNSSSNSFLKFEISSLSDSPPIVGSPTLASNSSTPNIFDKMDSMSNSNPLLTTASMPIPTNQSRKTFQMDEDDIFQVDKSDLFQEQTMSDLNGDTFYEMLSMDEILSADSNQQYIHQNNNPMGNFTQLTAVNFQNLQNAINENNSSGINECLSPSNVYNTIKTVYVNTHNNKTSTPGQLAAFSPGSRNSSTSTSSVVLNSSLSPPPSLPPHSTFTPSRVRSPRTARSSGGQVQHNPKYSTLHSLLMKKDPTAAEKAMLGKLQHASTPPAQLLTPGGNPTRRLNMNGGSVISRLSSSAPTQIGFEQIWQRREPKPHLLSTGSLAEGQPGSTSSLSGGLLSPENHDYSQDETFSDEEDSDHYEDLTSDSDIEDSKDQCKIFNSDPNNNQNFKTAFGTPNSKKSRFFWQYNVQAKGPKGQRLVIKTQVEDPHYLNEVTDPVFSPNCSVRGIKHSGKARKGDGNDLTPNAKKLNVIGKELDKLGRVINDMTPVSELPFNVRPKTRKEKNKLASRACRLKKKAQHEANKIKLFGLEHEHKRLMNGICQIKQLVALKCSNSKENQEEINQRIDQIVTKATVVKIAENSTEYVNRVLDRIKSGIPNGGLEDF